MRKVVTKQPVTSTIFQEEYSDLHLKSTLPPNDELGKVRRYFETLNDNFGQQFEKVWSSHKSIHETMVPYYGRHSANQHIHGKPLRFGYKLWSAATRLGYLAAFEPYQGAKQAKQNMG
ncbi:hypothetical protein ANN_17141 [Periplaneta americana]|uniref:PiggyBac transposable element-derived protein domain-containing protein n=1 Tax=Periplaneta americana TaxID=6978 RepID=A0ABQ8SS33_PERAM|nr:hypothetical protein ANN_17141 [Periplaneta americana]